MTERANQTIIRALVKMTAENLLSWDKQIPKVLLGYRLDAQASTKFSPFFLLHARPVVLPLVQRHRANLPPLYDELLTDSEVAKQAERLIALKAEATASILQGLEKQKPSYARRQVRGSLGKENTTELGTLPFGGLTAAQYLGLPVRVRATTRCTQYHHQPSTRSYSAKAASRASCCNNSQNFDHPKPYRCQRAALQYLHLLQLLDQTQQPQLLLNQSLKRLHQQSELQSTRQLAKDVGIQKSFRRETLF